MGFGEQRELFTLFHTVDVDGSGEFSRSKLREFIQEMGMAISEEHMDVRFHSYYFSLLFLPTSLHVFSCYFVFRVHHQRLFLKSFSLLNLALRSSFLSDH